MFKATTTVALLAFAAAAAAQDLVINTPQGVIACEPTLITWSGGTPPYFVSLLDGNDVNGAAIDTLQNNVTATSFTWQVNYKPGTQLALQVKDQTGTTKPSAVFPINAPPSGDLSCLGGSSGSSSATGGATSSSSAAGTTPASSSTGATGTPTSSSAAATQTAPSSIASSVSSAVSSAIASM
jgi:hypothetical protein